MPCKSSPQANPLVRGNDYVPSSYVIAASRMTAGDLISYFHDFQATLEYAQSAPDHAFERLVLNLSSVLISADGAKINESHNSIDEKVPQPTSATQIDTTTIRYPAIGTYHTRESHPIPESRRHVKSEVLYTRAYTTVPVLHTALTSINLSTTTGSSVSIWSTDIKSDGCTLNIDSKEASTLPGTGYAWLELDKDDPNFQYGWLDAIGSTWRTRRASKFIVFPHPYTHPPKVVTWLNQFRLKETSNWRICINAFDITENGFMINIDGVQDETDRIAISWVAYRADLPGAHSGTVESSSAFQAHGNRVGFGPHRFATSPRILMAINTFDVDCAHDVVLSVGVTDRSATGLTWGIGGLPPNTPYKIKASWIALA